MFNAEDILTLNELELSLYNYIISHKDKVIYMRIRDLANEAHVSTTTILRFCKKLHFNGFSEFKVRLKMSLVNQRTLSVMDDNSIFLSFLERTSTDSFKQDMDKACEIINKAKNVLFIGVGNSGALAAYGARYFSSLDKFSVYIDDPFYPISGSYVENSVTIALSVSGETPNTIDHVNRLKQENSKIISITNSKNSVLSKISDVNLSYYVQNQKIERYDITTQLPTLYIIETLGNRVYNLSKE